SDNTLPPDADQLGDLGMFERLRPGFFWGRSWADWSEAGRGLTWFSVDGPYYWFKEPGALGPVIVRALARNPGWETYSADAGTGAGVHEFTYVLRLHDGEWRASDPQRRSQELRHPPVVVRPNYPTEASLSADFGLLELSNNAMLSACYAEDQDLVVRFFEREGQAGEVDLKLGFTPAGVRAEDLLGQAAAAPIAVEERVVRVAVRPRQIVTLRLTR
ncbi:MAG: glycosyl hydrolase-related protein, partial [Anaerolineae bacterium]